MNMEFSFEIKIEDLDSIEVGGFNWVLFSPGWFDFYLRKSAEESKYYIWHTQYNGLGDHRDILKANPISFSNDWKKEFREIILKT